MIVAKRLATITNHIYCQKINLCRVSIDRSRVFKHKPGLHCKAMGFEYLILYRNLRLLFHMHCKNCHDIYHKTKFVNSMLLLQTTFVHYTNESVMIDLSIIQLLLCGTVFLLNFVSQRHHLLHHPLPSLQLSFTKN